MSGIGVQHASFFVASLEDRSPEQTSTEYLT